MAMVGAMVIDGLVDRDHRATGLVGTSNEVEWPRFDEVREFFATTARASPEAAEIRARPGVNDLVFGVPGGRSFIRVEATGDSKQATLAAAADGVSVLLAAGEADAGGGPSELRLTRPAELENEFDSTLTALAAGLLGAILAVVLIPAVDGRFGRALHRSQLEARFSGAPVIEVGPNGAGWGPLASRLGSVERVLVVGDDAAACGQVVEQLSSRHGNLIADVTTPDDLDGITHADAVLAVAVRRRSRLRDLAELGSRLRVANRPTAALLLDRR